MKTLEEIDQLEQSRFGRPQPRHGLKLLYWFANDCLSLNQNNFLQLTCYPKNGDFGFHLFKNRYERNSGKLLPDVTFPYYVVGNLSYLDASKLPSYVRKDYTGSQDNSNMDRIIVSLDNKWLHTIYVTQHSDLSNFNKHATYRISKHLILIIRDLTLEEFLLRTGYLKQQTNIFSTIPVKVPTYLSNPEPPCPTPPVTSSCIPAITSSTNQVICIQVESPPIMTNTQRNTSVESQLNSFVQDNIIQNLRISNLQPPSQDNQTPSTCISTTTSSTWFSNLQPPSQDNQTPSTCISTTTSSTWIYNLQLPSQDNQSPSTCISTTTSSTWIYNLQLPSQDNQTPSTCISTTTSSTWIYNLQLPSQDNQRTSHCTPSIMTSRNQDTDIESCPASQTNPYVITDDTKTYPTSIFDMARHCYCTIL